VFDLHGNWRYGAQASVHAAHAIDTGRNQICQAARGTIAAVVENKDFHFARVRCLREQRAGLY
jgi:hypothetical protein